MQNTIIDAIIDSIKLLPFLFIAFLFIELLEHKLNNHTKKIIKKSGKLGPLIGSLLGLIPQCGFSVAATNLYITRIISLGTLISIYLSTSDEMLPILYINGASWNIILKLLAIKFIIGIIWGFLIDFISNITHHEKEKLQEDYHICTTNHCHCNESIIKSSLIHTINIFIFILIINIIINIIMYLGAETFIKSIFNKNNIFSPLISSLIGLIPNCATSVIITELYLDKIIPLSSTISGLLAGSGVAILVLFRTNSSLKESLKILLLIYLISSITGIILNLF